MMIKQKTVALMLVIVMLLAILPVSAIASNKVETLKYNVWYKLKEDEAIYKIKVSTDMVFIAKWKNLKGDASAALYLDRECDEDSIYQLFGYEDTASGTDGVVLYRGTYYIKLHDYDDKAKIMFSTKKNTINKPNYCIGKAITMSKNKSYELSQTKDMNYKRWYRIKLTKSQTISIVGYDSSYTLYDRNLNKISCKYNYGTKTITTRGKQPKGTYYLALNEEDLEYIMDKGYYYNIRWK